MTDHKPSAGQPRVSRVQRGFCFSDCLHRTLIVSASGNTLHRFFRFFVCIREACLLCEQLRWHSVLLDPAPPSHHAPQSDLLVVCPGFRFDKFSITRHISFYFHFGQALFPCQLNSILFQFLLHQAMFIDFFKTFRIQPVVSKTRTYPGRVATGRRTAGRRGRAGTGSTGCRRRDCSPRRKETFLSPRRWKNDLLGVPLEARTREVLSKPMAEQNLPLNRG